MAGRTGSRIRCFKCGIDAHGFGDPHEGCEASAAAQELHYAGADFSVVVWLEKSQHTVLFGGMGQRMAIGAKDVVIER